MSVALSRSNLTAISPSSERSAQRLPGAAWREVLQNLKLKFGSLCEAFLQVSSMSLVQQLVAKGKIMDKNKRPRRKKRDEKFIDPSQLFELDFPEEAIPTDSSSAYSS